MAIVDCIHTATRNENQAEISAPVKDGIPGREFLRAARGIYAGRLEIPISRERKSRGGISRPGDLMKTLFYCVSTSFRKKD
jgi:hypothetical protein